MCVHRVRTLQVQDRQRNRSDLPLVIYVLLESDDPETEANFMYYVREAIREHDGCTHLILVDQRRVRLSHSALSTPWYYGDLGQAPSFVPFYEAPRCAMRLVLSPS